MKNIEETPKRKPSLADCRGFISKALSDIHPPPLPLSFFATHISLHFTLCVCFPPLFFFVSGMLPLSLALNICWHCDNYSFEALPFSSIEMKRYVLIYIETRTFPFVPSIESAGCDGGWWWCWVSRGKLSVQMSNAKRKTIKKSWAFFSLLWTRNRSRSSSSPNKKNKSMMSLFFFPPPVRIYRIVFCLSGCVLNEEKRRRAEDAGGRVREIFFLLSGYMCVMWVWVMWLLSKDGEKSSCFKSLSFQQSHIPSYLCHLSLFSLTHRCRRYSPWARFLALFLFSFSSLIFGWAIISLGFLSFRKNG